MPKSAFHEAELQPFTNRTTPRIESSETHCILSWTLHESEDYERFAEADGSGWMRRLIPLRDELLRSDLRRFYLGWLAGADALRGDALEPQLPSGLREPSPAQQALAEFLEVDPDLLEAAHAGMSGPGLSAPARIPPVGRPCNQPNGRLAAESPARPDLPRAKPPSPAAQRNAGTRRPCPVGSPTREIELAHKPWMEKTSSSTPFGYGPH